MANCRKCHVALPEGAKFCPSCGTRQDQTRKPKTRGNGTGTVFKRPNGTWIAMKTLERYVDENGKSRRVTASKSGFKTKKEALAYLPNLTTQTKQEQRKTTTFKQVYDLWEPTHKKGKSTKGCYSAALNHFRAVWNEPMIDVTVDDLQECMDDCPAGRRTMENMKALCNLMYKYAIPRHMATLNMGPYLVINGEGGIGKEGLPLDALEKLKQNVSKVPYADYIVAQCYLGFRPSELLDLQVASYDRAEKAFIGGSKTDAGKDRIVTVSPKIQPTIDRLTHKKIAGHIFCASNGSRLSAASYRKEFYKVLETCGIDNPIIEVNGVKRRTYTPHSCRHTFATLMKDVKAPDEDKLALIGHTSTEMLRHYQDVDLEGLRRITDAI